jgi:hypothetical protein
MHYTEDPLMDEPRTQHRMMLEPVGTTRSLLGGDAKLYGAACAAGDWMDARPYDFNGHAEGFDLHMQAVQAKVHEEKRKSSE